MNRCLIVAVLVMLLGGCRDATTHTANNHQKASTSKGQFAVPQEDLPIQIIQLAQTLERLPIVSSDAEFRSMLAMCGLNKEPDWYKDGGHFWYLDEEFRSETDPDKRMYRVTIGHFPRDSKIVFYFASIDRVFSAAPRRKTLWEIDWPIASDN